ncbi:capsular polysaccharide biosynthesis protein [Sinorhizobium meliloti]|uniref:capsular polysaccharide export protein, LipB/KpsS family n=1 Tax=Rhizobium meliloti TaxID=382 RepID=UPI000B4A2F2B|nr:capsular polysaccharide biosynthesis protein [Sinorhizobium meliloti]ASQ07411.1 cell surface protein [Sinorhizobium meliloti]MDW9666039.1 capsular polysaccharide biosynthesis protein [Sinorhizobium meliloti]MDW9700777.1 capsular polysaccharide biosynthesis protein [Sinorhizobium meliloti]MDW9721521.1 capsular polysaccharide biosynthesis protein [Sinorhizobium meliloti]MDW9727789.1 capsular polysaccharide biosynthesis protein [Sinorhizobium meliloti]
MAVTRRQREDFATISSAPTPEPVTTFAVQIVEWKREPFERYFPNRRFHFLPMNVGVREFERVWRPRILAEKDAEFLAWGPELPGPLEALARARNIPVTFIEDGFLRSTRPSASRTPPLSLALDGRALYFDCRHPSDLEVLLKTYDFEADAALMERARAGIALLTESGISKYNGARRRAAEEVYGEKTRKRVLVVGQVEDDASVRYGCLARMSNNDLVRLANSEQADAQILYKPHPDVLSRVRPARSDPAEVAHLCELVTDSLPLAEALRTVDHVYTITSLAGFEALIRGIPVTTAGCPFYAGWGLTDDRQTNPRRGRQLSIEALFAGAYLLYPRYFDPETGAQTSFEATVTAIRRQLDEPQSLGPPRPQWRAWGPYGLLGWRHLLTAFVTAAIRKIGSDRDVEDFRADPIRFFRSLSDRKYRIIGRILYPFG